MSLLTTIMQMVDGKKQRRRIPYNRRRIVWLRDGKRCRYGLKCNQQEKLPLYGCHMDHVKPVFFHGNDYTFNLCVACKDCNLSRGANRMIKPNKLSVWRRVYGVLLMIKYRDFPRLKDFT